MKRTAQFLTRSLLIPALFLSALGAGLVFPYPTISARQSESVFAMSDIHGNFEAAVGLLEKAGLIDSSQKWSGGRNTFVQTGDYMDRGPEVRRVLDFLMELEDDAPSNQVIILLGNHEMMNIVGDLRYVTAPDYASFRDTRSEARRNDAFEDYVDFLEDRAVRFGRPAPEISEEFERDWMEDHPLGFVEHREAFSSDGDYGSWLRQRQTLVKQVGTIFTHAGISPAIANISMSIEEINASVQDEIRMFDQHKKTMVDEGIALPFFTWTELLDAAEEERHALVAEVAAERAEVDSQSFDFVFPARQQPKIQMLEAFLSMGRFTISEDGVLWFRGYAEWTDDEGSPLIQELLDQFDAKRFVVGHTPRLLGVVASRFEERVILLDTGMLSSYYTGGRPSMLEIDGGVLRPVYLD